MKKIKLQFLMNFNEDKRMSMNIYGQQTYDYFKKFKKKIITKKIIPKIKDDFLNSFLDETNKMRYQRYITYPKIVSKLPYSDISHIIDHQYAHLYNYINSKKKFITVHDLVPFVYSKRLNKNPFLLKYSFSFLKKFDKVFAVSENTKNDIINYTDCPDKKIVVIGESVEPIFKKKKINKNLIFKKYKIPSKKFKILIHGTRGYENLNYFIKNSETIFKTINQLKNVSDIIFIQMGGKLNYEKNIHLKNKIIQLPFVKRNEIPNIYLSCDMLFYPSLYEGFGRPLLEAMQTGLPILTSNNSSIPEVVGDCAIMHDAKNWKKFANSIIKIKTNKKIYNKMVRSGFKQSKKFISNEINHKIYKHYFQDINNEN